jgi:hypothetical protein
MTQAVPVWKRIPEPVFRWFRRVVVSAVVALILYQLSRIGWSDLVQNLPVHVGFYILAVILYFTLPLAEITIYRRLWGIKPRVMLQTSLIKRVFNEEFFGYSGEVYLFAQGKRYSQRTERQLMRDIRDVSILSAANSNIIALILLAVLLFAGFIPASFLEDSVSKTGLVAGAVVLGIAGIVLMRYRKHWFALPLPHAGQILGIFMLRFTVHYALVIWQWHLVMPDTPVSVWLLYITLTIVLNRIPFLPGKDLIFVWAGIALSGHLDVPAEAIAGMLIVSGTLTRLANLMVYVTNRQALLSNDAVHQ